MDILAALFVEGIDMRQVPGPTTRIDLTGVMFSLPAPSAPPVTIGPHLVVIVREPRSGTGSASLISEFFWLGPDGTSEPAQVARNVQLVSVEPGRFGRQLVRAELEFPALGTIEARCRLNENGHVTAVPLSLLPPV